MVQRETGEVSYLVGGQQITDLALNGRNFVSPLALNPRVVSETLFDQEKEGWQTQYIFVNGLRADYDNYSLDGACNVDPGSAGAIMNNYPSIDAVADDGSLPPGLVERESERRRESSQSVKFRFNDLIAHHLEFRSWSLSDSC